MKSTFLAAALIAVVISPAIAQDNDRLPQASLGRELNVQGSNRTAAYNLPHRSPTPPRYCKPCLFYAGDFDSNASDANGLANEVDLIVSTGAATYTPFIVPKGKTWTVTGLFTNNFMLGGGDIDPVVIPYEVRKRIPKAGGSGAELVCHGKKPGTLWFVIGFFGYSIYATKVEQIKGCRLPEGKYWMSVVPYCTNKNDDACTNSYRAFLSNDDGLMNNRFGPVEPVNDSFFNSEFFGANWEPSTEQQTSKRFSVGVEGTSK
jgi:hypothetical protein